MFPVADALRGVGDAFERLAAAAVAAASAIFVSPSAKDAPPTFANGDTHRDFTLSGGEVYRSRPATLADIPALRGLERQLVAAERPMDATISHAPSLEYYEMDELVAPADGRTRLVVVEFAGGIIACGYVQYRPSQRFKAHRYHGYLGKA